MITRKQFLISLLLFIIVSALLYGFSPKPIQVEVIEVSRKALQIVIEEEGKTRLKDRFQIYAPVAGTLCRLEWEVGDKIQAGQKLCEITPLKSVLLDPRSKADAEDRVAAAKATLRTAKAKVLADTASVDYALSEYKRIKQVYDKKLVSRSELERVETEKRRAYANLESSHFASESARYALSEVQNALAHFATKGGEKEGEKVIIHSPIDGQVLAIHQESEVTVQAGQVLLDIGNAKLLEVEVEVLSADAVKIQSGMLVEFNRWGGDQPLNGQVRLIEPVGFTKVSALGVEEQRVKIIIDITSPIEQWSRLGDGYRVDTQFILWQGQNILQAPENALFRQGEEWAVFLANKDHSAELRKVILGKRSGLYAQIISGLNEGDVIILYPDEKIKDSEQIDITSQ